jgi:hypothetical protein
MPDRALLAHWKEADDQASRAEKELKAQFDAYAAGTGPRPDMALVLQSKLLRAAATELLNEYIEATGQQLAQR